MTYSDTYKENLASRLPTFLTSNVFVEEYLTEREKFVVPVKAIGARALLDFPDQVNFSTCPVKYSSTKTLLVRNVGNREARFSLYVSE